MMGDTVLGPFHDVRKLIGGYRCPDDCEKRKEQCYANKECIYAATFFRGD